MIPPFRCPVCKSTLTEGEKSYTCPNGHSFDKAKQGYVNLLLSSKQGVHGDDKTMVKARQDFLEKGYYSKMRDCVKSLIGGGKSVLDAGCGEGYYTTAFAEKNTVVGIDVSKEALKIAARRCPNGRFAVASIYDMPFENESVDVIVNIFAPDSPKEYLRLLSPNGRLITVTPMEDHLMELKAAVYDKPYKNPYVSPEKNGFAILSSTEIKYTVSLNCNEDIRSLFKMTPYYYNTSEKDKAKLDPLPTLETRAEFLVTEYRKI